MLTMPKNRCFNCGKFVGERFAGYENDRASNRGRLWCERCVALAEEERQFGETDEDGGSI